MGIGHGKNLLYNHGKSHGIEITFYSCLIPNYQCPLPHAHYPIFKISKYLTLSRNMILVSCSKVCAGVF
ncbi:hypothetical protein [Tolypothrix sp. VBCCA 56010]|uniref:hypothetical protein n=1 Tax=Tolypothrix sp. VBCCA 56010 TaxID=3137731 RepID=UPI003D7F028D